MWYVTGRLQSSNSTALTLTEGTDQTPHPNSGGNLYIKFKATIKFNPTFSSCKSADGVTDKNKERSKAMFRLTIENLNI